jgi:hypothetical protein
MRSMHCGAFGAGSKLRAILQTLRRKVLAVRLELRNSDVPRISRYVAGRVPLSGVGAVGK